MKFDMFRRLLEDRLLLYLNADGGTINKGFVSKNCRCPLGVVYRQGEDGYALRIGPRFPSPKKASSDWGITESQAEAFMYGFDSDDPIAKARASESYFELGRKYRKRFVQIGM